MDIYKSRETPPISSINNASPSKNIVEYSGNLGYLVYYTKDIFTDINNIPNADVVILTPYIAAIFVSPESDNKVRALKNIDIIEPVVPYILTDVSPLDSANISQFSQGYPLSLNGTGVIVALIDTGIDYLNKEFMREDDTSRVLAIWDQSDSSGNAPPNIGYGSEYSNSQINNAIKAQAAGQDPYSIVPEKDISGHGTQCAGIIGARGYGEVKGAAPNCDFIVVKLRSIDEIEAIPGNPNSLISLYSNLDILIALRYVVEYRQILKSPMVIFLPVSTNYGGHSFGRPIEQVISYYSFISNIIFAIGTGNQGNSQTHVSNNIKNTNNTSTIELQIGEHQNTLHLSIWSISPDKISIGITSPSGQVVSRIPKKSLETQEISFLYEKTTIKVTYYSPILTTGDDTIDIEFINPAKGIWKIQLFGDYIVNGNFNAWIDQRPLSRPGTLLLNSDNFTTLTIPSNVDSAISTAFYNQNNNSIAETSGLGFTTDNRVKPDLATGGVNVLTTNTNNRTTTISGSSAATAVLAGAITLLLQWAIIDGNLYNISTEILRALLIRGTKKRTNDIYPNPYWGYGQLDLMGTFDAIRGIYNTPSPSFTTRNLDKCDDNIEVEIPIEIFNRLT